MGSPGSIATLFADSVLFCRVPDDILFNILRRLDDDPRDLARLACVSTRFCKIIKSVCWKLACQKTLPLLVAELLQAPSPAYHPLSEPPGGWAALQKLHVCCPGLWHAGVLLRNWDFELDQELDWFDDASCSHRIFRGAIASEVLRIPNPCDPPRKKPSDKRYAYISHEQPDGRLGAGVSILATNNTALCAGRNIGNGITGNGVCPRGDEVEHGTECNKDGPYSGSDDCVKIEASTEIHGVNVSNEEATLQSTIYAAVDEVSDEAHSSILIEGGRVDEEKQKQEVADESSSSSLIEVCHEDEEKQKQHRMDNLRKRQRDCQHILCHIASGSRNLSREQGNKLLANRFRTDSLYICDWPGCIHPGDKRIYKLFRGVFKNFKSSHVYRNLKDMQAKPMNVGCAFCVCKYTWNMVSTFCLKRSIEFHDDGEPVVRAYVCENGHVAGAWTDRPIYTP